MVSPTMCQAHQLRTLFRRVAAVGCAVAYLAGASETLPQLLALGALLEGSHTVHVSRDQGQISIVLSHERGGARERCVGSAALRHRHGPAAHVICFFATHSVSLADHVANFATVSACEQSGSKSTLRFASGPVVAAAPIAPAVSVLTAGTLSPLNCFRYPEVSDQLVFIRSSVLLI